MTWNELLDEFRALGGIAENVVLAEGALGRGIFVIDPGKPAVLHCPAALQVPVDDVTTDGERMTVASTGVGARERAFFEAYQMHFGWGAGAYEGLHREQLAWHTLPAELRERIGDLAALNVSDMRYRAPDAEVCFHNYIHARKFLRDGTSYLVPLIDLVNHSSFMPEYVYADGIGVRGTFSSEMLVKYNGADPWGLLLLYGFATPGPAAFSLAITIALPDGRRLSIARNIGDYQEVHGVRLPTLAVNGDELLISHLTLGFAPAKDLPRAMFRKVMQTTMDTATADAIFENIQYYNRVQFLAFLRAVRKHEGHLVRMLEEATINQLDALNACIGARSL